jgi:fructokinase
MSSDVREFPVVGLPRRPHFVCWGEVLWDLFPDGRMLGGAPANVAYHLAALGERVSLVSRVGDDDLGREARRVLADHGVGVPTLQIDERRPTGRVEVSLDRDGEPHYQLIPGCAWEHIETDAAAAEALAVADAFCFGTLSQRVDTAQFERALTLLPGDCVRVCDINLRPAHVDFEVLKVALAAADVVKLNQREAELIAARAGISDLAGWLFEHMQVEVMALTRGAGGCLLIRGTELADHPGFAAEPGGDNVGAGDGFTAVLARMLVKDRPLGDIAEAGNRYGAFVASQRGATPAIPDALRDALD